MTHLNASRSLGQLAVAAFLVWSSSTNSAEAQEFAGLRPAPEHEMLKKDVGTWDAKMTLFPPGGEPVTSDAVETNEMLGNFWVVSRFEGTLMQMPFKGAGTFGYDPHEKKYVGTWIDSMSPYGMNMKGDYDPATKTMTMLGESRDPVTGEMSKSKSVSRYNDDGSRTFELSMEENGELTKVLEIQYTRKKP